MEPLKLLIVDDESGMRLGVQRALKNFQIPIPESDEFVSIQVEMAETGEEGIQLIHANRPDILLLDYKLPGQNGLEILEHIQTEDSEMVIIMITAYASLETAVSAIKQGAFDFLAKPFTPDELKRMLLKAAQNLLLARQLKRMAQEKQQVRFEFTRVLGHELKSPLNAIEGYLNLMQSRTAGNQLESYDHMVNRSLERLEGMRKLIADLLDLTRIESGKRQRNMIIQDIIPLAHCALENVKQQAEQQKINFSIHSVNQLDFYCDTTEMEMIFNNLMTNAVKYNKPGGSVDLTITNESGDLVITIRDTGIGMSQQEIAGLFQEFKRIKNEKTKNILGSGLGLTIVKKIVKLYNGEIKVESQVDSGTTFTISLSNGQLCQI